MQGAIRLINIIKSKALNSRCFTLQYYYNEMGPDQTIYQFILKLDGCLVVKYDYKLLKLLM